MVWKIGRRIAGLHVSTADAWPRKAIQRGLRIIRPGRTGSKAVNAPEAEHVVLVVRKTPLGARKKFHKGKAGLAGISVQDRERLMLRPKGNIYSRPGKENKADRQ